MKSFLLLCVVLVARIHAVFIPPFPMEYDDIANACRTETGYTDEVAAKEKASFFAENRGLRAFNYCFLEKTGFVTRDGKLNISNDALAKVTPSVLKDTLGQCNTRDLLHVLVGGKRSIFRTCFHSGIAAYMRSLEYMDLIQSFNDNFTTIVESCLEIGYTDERTAEEEKLKKFNNCFLEKVGFGGDEKFDIDDAVAKIPESILKKINESCASKSYTKKGIPEYYLYSACVNLGVSNNFRSTKLQRITLVPETDHVTQIVNFCHMESGLRYDLLYYVIEGEPTEKNLRKFNDCFLQKTGFVTSDGKLNIDAALAKLPPSFAKPIIEHCQANIILKYATDSVQDFCTCYHHGVQDRVPVILEEPFSQSYQFVLPGTSFAKKSIFVY